MLLLQLAYSLKDVPTTEITELNTDAVQFLVDSEYKEQAHKVLHDWEDLTGLELEQDKIVKLVQRDVNNYCEIVQMGDNDYKVHYKGGEFRGKHKFKWDKENKTFRYSFDDDIESNSMTIVSEALLKNLLFNIPIEDTIHKCDDIFRFQIITHLGSTYEKMVQETPNGDVELQRNNRIYAGLKPSGLIIKVKYDGRRDSLANCPPNPVVDNANECTIDDINKEWYIDLTKQKLNDFKGVKRLEAYKKEELLTMANELGLDIDKKTKKSDLIELIKDKQKEKDNMAQKTKEDISTMNIYSKLNKIKEDIKQVEFIMDCSQASNLGGREYPSIGQYYKVLQDECIKYNVYFQWDVVNTGDVDRDIFKPAGKMPQHSMTVLCTAEFTNIDNTEECVRIKTCASGSDTLDKYTSIASSMAFRNFFDKNFTPSYLTIEDFNTETEISNNEIKTEEPKVPTFIPQEKKEELTKQVVAEEQHEDSDQEDITRIIGKIMTVREKLGNNTWGDATLDGLVENKFTSADLVAIELKIDNKLDSIGGEQ